MSATVDANILVYASNEADPVHAAARELVERLADGPGEADGFWQTFGATAGASTRGNAVPDAHVAALMRQHGVAMIYTRDRDYRRFDGVTAVDPFD